MTNVWTKTLRRSALALALFGFVFLPAQTLAFQSPAYDRGLTEMRRGDYDGAIMSFGETIGFDMNNMDAYFKRGECFYKLNNLVEAAKDFSHIIDFNPANADALLWRGTINARLEKHEEAVRDYLAAIRQKPELAKQFAAGESTTQDTGIRTVQVGGRGLIMQSENSARPRAVGKPQNQGAVRDYEQAMTLYMGQKQTDALPAQTPLNATGEPVANNRRIVAAQPGGGQFNERRKRKLRSLNLPDTDQDVFPAGVSNASSSSLDKDAVRARIAKLNNAFELDDRNQQLLYRRGVLYEKLENYDQALADYSQAINLAPMEAKFYLARARVYHTLKQPFLEQNDVQKAQSVDMQLPKHIKFVEGAPQNENRDFKNPVE